MTESAIKIDRWQFMPRREGDDQIAMNHRRWARRHDETAIRLARECRNRPVYLAWVTYIDRAHFQAKRRCHSLDHRKLADPGGRGGIAKHCRLRHARRDLLEQFQPFSAQAVVKHHKAGRVAAGPRQLLDKTGTHRVDDDREYDRHGMGRFK